MFSSSEQKNLRAHCALPSDLLQQIAQAAHYDPHSVLGQHPVSFAETEGTVIRTLRPLATEVYAVFSDESRMQLEHLFQGIWQGITTGNVSDYRIEAQYANGDTWLAEEPYRFAPTLGEIDLHLIQEGRHEELWRVLGAHYQRHPPQKRAVSGVSFSVWAPHARAVRVIGDFNSWNGTLHAMRTLGSTGVWEIFVPEAAPGDAYKFEILSQNGDWLTKADPMARYTEPPPGTASLIGETQYHWGDAAWLSQRAQANPHTAPMSVYEMHLGSWKPGHSYRSIADDLISYLTELHFTHVEFMPLAEHPFGGSWGYQVTSYYAPTARFGHPDDLRYLIDRLHQAGIGVLLDWVPGHFPKDEWALARFDGEALYEHPDPRRGEQPDWGTLVFNFGNNQVRNFLVANALYWLEEFHLDGLRVDAVASMLYLDYSRKAGEWLPNEQGGRENYEAIRMLQEVNATAYKKHPGIIMIAEESTNWPGVSHRTEEGGLGFGLKWNMGWMHDSLHYIATDPLYRSHHHNEITFSFLYAFSENFILPISHDEVVHGKGSLLAKMPGDEWQKRANLRAYLGFMWAHPGKKLLFMGQEFGQPSEWSENGGLEWRILQQPHHQALHHLVSRLNTLYRENPELSRDHEPGGVQWIDGSAANHNVLSFLRWDHHHNPVAVLINFSGNPIHNYRVGLPAEGIWHEILNTDALEYGGSGVGNFGSLRAENVPWSHQPASVALTLPPLAALYLKPRQIQVN